jgi:hypothetical protein
MIRRLPSPRHDRPTLLPAAGPPRAPAPDAAPHAPNGVDLPALLAEVRAFLRERALPLEPRVLQEEFRDLLPELGALRARPGRAGSGRRSCRAR